jgi:hypothetical protein
MSFIIKILQRKLRFVVFRLPCARQSIKSGPLEFEDQRTNYKKLT